MSTLSIFIIVFIILVVVIAWITTEMTTNKTSRENRKQERKIMLLENENDEYVNNINAVNQEYAAINEEYRVLLPIKTQVRTLEKEYRKLAGRLTRTANGIATLRSKVHGKKYASNFLAKEILTNIETYYPRDKGQETVDDEHIQNVLRLFRKAGGGNAMEQ